MTGGALYQELMDAVFNDDNREKEDIFALEEEENEPPTQEEIDEEEESKGKTHLDVIKEKFIAAGWKPETVNIDTILKECQEEESAVIFRIKRKRKYDTNLFVLIGKTERHALVFEGKFKVRFKEGEPEVSLLRKSSLKVLYDKNYQPINGGEQVEKYFKKLIWFLKSWVDLID